MPDNPLVSVRKEDFRRDTFRTGGPGGQKQNKTSSGVRLTHLPSGAVGESREHRSQQQNEKAAFTRCVATWDFQRWLKLETAEALSGQTVDEIVDTLMEEKNLKVEVREDGQWTTHSSLSEQTPP